MCLDAPRIVLGIGVGILSGALTLPLPGCAGAQNASQTAPLGDVMELCRAWANVAVSFNEKKGGPRVKIDEGLLQQFVGTVESVLGVQPPEWWQELVMTAAGYSRTDITFHRRTESPYRQVGLGFLGWGDTLLEEKDGTVLATVAGDRRPIPKYALKGAKQEVLQPGISVGVSASRTYLAVHSALPDPFRVFCINAANGRIQWPADVEARGPMDYEIMDPVGVVGHHWVTLLVHDDVLFVFGGSEWVAYVEAFDVKSGERKCRFATSEDQKRFLLGGSY